MHIRLGFMGAAQNVTGSRYLVEANDTTLLVDCGLYQERELRARNWNAFPIAAETIDAVLLTHAHLDHCGWLPKLAREGFRGRIYSTAATSEIVQIMLMDSAHRLAVRGVGRTIASKIKPYWEAVWGGIPDDLFLESSCFWLINVGCSSLASVSSFLVPCGSGDGMVNSKSKLQQFVISTKVEQSAGSNELMNKNQDVPVSTHDWRGNGLRA